MRARVGIIGWNYPEWKGLVYPASAKPGEFLRHYAERYPIVEAASSYYGLPKPEGVEGWATQTPDDFEMSLKVPDWILRRRGAELSKALDALLARLAPLRSAGKLGTLVAQFHPSFTREKRADELAAFVRALPHGPRWAVELRHPSWWREETYDLLRARDVALVWSDLADLRTPTVVTAGSLYLRLFGDRALEPPYDRKRRDATARLADWAERVQEAAPLVERADVMVSKFLEGYAPASAATLGTMLDVPPVRAAPGRTAQSTLF